MQAAGGLSAEGQAAADGAGRARGLETLVLAALGVLLLLLGAVGGHFLGRAPVPEQARMVVGGGALFSLVGFLVAAIGLVLWGMRRATVPAAAAEASPVSGLASPKEFSLWDEATGLYSRRFFLMRLDEEVLRYRRFQHPVSVVLIGVEGLRTGSPLEVAAARDALRRIAEILLQHSRRINVICRYGEAELAVLLVETPRQGARRYVERMRPMLATAARAHERSVQVSCAVAAIPENASPVAEELVHAAEHALYAQRLGDPRRECAGASEPSEEGAPERPRLALVEPSVADELERLVRTDVPGGVGGWPRMVAFPAERAPERAGAPGLVQVTSGLALEPPNAATQAALEALGLAIATRDPGTYAHSRRVHAYAVAIARAYGVPEDDLRDIAWGVLLHDVGKLGIPDAILFKPGPLTPDEWKVMRTHPELGRRILEGLQVLRGAIPVVYHHHERWDGTGYPLGLSGEDIPLGARIFAVADAFDAMTYDRPYSRAISFDAAREEIRRSAGTQLDPVVVATFDSLPLAAFAETQRSATA